MQRPLWYCSPPAAPMLGTMQETYKESWWDTFLLRWHLCWEGSAHGVVVTHAVALSVCIAVHVELHNVPAVPLRQITINRSAHQANLWFRKPSVRWSCNQRKKKLRSSPESDSIHEFTKRKVLLTSNEVGKIPIVVVKDGFEVFDKFLNNILHHHVIAFVTFLFPQQDLKKICSVILYELVSNFICGVLAKF